jgi:16S rRNA C967 or C1407 C5-methylase (RsmB/RsmF family)/NOL1/NOP2/fmu family ribosome biogenesis protein
VNLPAALLTSLQGLKGFDETAFVQVHADAVSLTSVRINPSKSFHDFQDITPVPWTKFGFYLAQRPSFTFDPLFHAGCYYVQEASSMLLEQAITQWEGFKGPQKVLDLCASPGGKSTHIQSLLPSDSILVTNEVIRSRATVLKDNIIKWGTENVVVTNNDPEDFASVPEYFDIVVVDAPCSGSGLFRRDPEAIEEWSPQHVQLCSMRQQRILAAAMKTLRPGGLLVYSTCSFSKEEDEEIVQWLQSEISASPIKLKLENHWGFEETGHGFKAWPNLVRGEGFFLAALTKNGEDHSDFTFKYAAKSKQELAIKQDLQIISNWIDAEAYQFVKNQQTIWAWPKELVADFQLLFSSLQVLYAGIRVGELMRDKLIPDHSLALSGKTLASIPRLNLARENAIKYLQRKDFEAPPASKGWHLVTYQDQPIGWANVLPGRINNYYPKELRILKEQQG